jgi:ribosomal protein L20A (L18A)
LRQGRANASKFNKSLLTKILAYEPDNRMGFIVELIFLSLGVRQKLKLRSISISNIYCDYFENY